MDVVWNGVLSRRMLILIIRIKIFTVSEFLRKIGYYATLRRRKNETLAME